MVLFERRFPKLTYLSDGYYLSPEFEEDQEDVGVAVDQEDRLPRELFVRRFDILCFGLAIVTYTADVVSDMAVAYMHMREEHVIWAFAVLALSAVPSIILNIVTFLWILDDEARTEPADPAKSACSKGIIGKGILCLLQCGPLMFYAKAALSGIKFRREKDTTRRRQHFCRMVEAERDATLLRFFEAFLESAPQLLLQGYILLRFAASKPDFAGFPYWVYIQLASILFSLISVCWTFCAQHRSLRMARPDKVNMHPQESFLQLLWRFFTVFSRFLVLIQFALAYQMWIFAFFAAHYFVSVFVTAALQSVSAPNSAVEIGLILICASVHQFTPFNMAEGESRWRYFTAYCIEFVEGVVLIGLCLIKKDFVFPWFIELSLTALGSFVLGIAILALYYCCFHPNRRRHIRLNIEKETKQQGDAESVKEEECV